MIPDELQSKRLWNIYHLPDAKKRHVALVALVAVFLAERLLEERAVESMNIPLVRAAALLHDIDKAIPKLPGEQHPDTAVRILREGHMDEVADIVRTHPVHAILDPVITPQTWEAKVVFLADKMVKQEIITVDQRFQLWREDRLPPDALRTLEQCYPRVKALESEVCNLVRIRPEDVAKRVMEEYTSTRIMSQEEET